MSTAYHRSVAGRKNPPQSKPLSKEQVQNNAGGFVYSTGPWVQLERFLVLGSEGGTYYVDEQELTTENTKIVQQCLTLDFVRTINTIVEVSESGRAPKNDPAIFALALAASFEVQSVRQLALSVLPQVCRIPTHLFHFASFVDELRGWGKGLRKAVGDWYNRLEPERLAQYLVKYKQRDGWSHRDLLRLAHPKPKPGKQPLFAYATKESWEEIGSESIIMGFELAKRAEDKKTVVKLIEEYELTREMIPTQFLNDVEVWNALLQKMPPEAMIRNLGKMTEVGLLKPLSDASKLVKQKLHDLDHLRKARIHPFKVLVALKTYSSGHGDKGKLSWYPVPQVVEALDDAFYGCFKNVEPTGKRMLLGLDVSGSMSSRCGSLPLTCAEAVAAQAMVFAKLEQEYYIHGFCDRFVDLKITAKDTLESATQKAQKHNFGSTDAAVPMLWALAQGINVDAFLVMTDNETWAGSVHPQKALQKYRDARGIKAKEVVVGMTATDFSIADPQDTLALDVVGMDTSVPEVISNFLRG